jgi:GT2 family glycosyltransferase
VSGLSIVVISWNTRELTLACLDAAVVAASGFSSATALPCELVLVDNGSADGTAAAVAVRHPHVKRVVLPVNGGFAVGANAGYAAADGDVVLWLNSDARIDATALIVCWLHLAAHPRVGIVGPQLLHADGRRQHSAHAFPSLLDEFVPAFAIDCIRPRRRPAKWLVGERPIAVDAVQGAALFARRRVLEQVGPFSDDYFFYLEETDLCWRAARAGFGVELVPEARVVHDAGASSKRIAPVASRIEYHRSLYHFLERRRGVGAKRIAIALRTLRGAIILAGLALVGPLSAGARRRFAERRALLAWHLLGRPAGKGLAELRDPRPGLPGPASAACGAD